MAETIGLLGGSFNPIHNGHLAMAEAAYAELALSRIILLPDGDPPHKSAELAAKRHRLRMVELAARYPLEVSAMEVERPGKTYTVDTLEAMRRLYPSAQLYMIIGADTLNELHTWKDAQRVFTLCRFAVFARDDLPMIEVPGADVVRMQTAIPGLSATEIRGRVHRGLSLEGYVPASVENYIGAERLYSPPQQMRKREIRKRLEKILPVRRFQHVLGVERTMRKLARRWAYHPSRAALTGLLHDCAKTMPLEEMRAFVDAQGVQADPMRRQTPELLHAVAGMAMARSVYGVTDPDILHAIRYHNTGCAQMGILDRMLYVADMCEPGRPNRPWMKRLRLLSMEDLDEATRFALQIKLDNIQKWGQDAHPDTAAALAAMEKIIGEGKL